MPVFDVTVSVSVELEADDTDEAVEITETQVVKAVKELLSDDPSLKVWVGIDDVVEMED